MYGIFTYIWVIYGVNVDKYSIHGWSGYGTYGWYIELVNGIVNQGIAGEKRPCWDVFRSPSSIAYLQHSSSIWVWLFWLKKSKTCKSTRGPFVSTTCGITATTSVLYLLSKSMSSSFFLRLSHSFRVYPTVIGDFPIGTPMNRVDFPACHVSGGSPVVFCCPRRTGTRWATTWASEAAHAPLNGRELFISSKRTGTGTRKGCSFFGLDIPSGNLR